MKTEMKGTTSRWGPRADAKATSNSLRRVNDKIAENNQEGVPAHHRKKDRKHWCRGKVGTPHQPECCLYTEVKHFGLSVEGSSVVNWRILVCRVCGKHLDFYYPMNRAGSTPKPPPPWVDK